MTEHAIIACKPFGEIENTSIERTVLWLEDLKRRTNWKPGEDILPHIPNYVTNSYLDVSFDLKELMLYLPTSCYRPDGFAAAVLLRLTKDRACLAFKNGKLVVTGSRSLYDVIYATLQYRIELMNVRHLVKVLNNDGTPMKVMEDEIMDEPEDSPFPNHPRPKVAKQVYAFTKLDKLMKFSDFSVVNVVGAAVIVVEPIDLALLGRIMTTSVSEWEPQNFPGLKCRVYERYCPLSIRFCTFLIFDSGLVVGMGATCYEDLVNGFLFIKCLCKYFIDRKALKQNITDKFKYRIEQIVETASLMDEIPESERIGLETKILEECSVKCFDDYLVGKHKEEQENNPLRFIGAFSESLGLQKGSNDSTMSGITNALNAIPDMSTIERGHNTSTMRKIKAMRKTKKGHISTRAKTNTNQPSGITKKKPKTASKPKLQIKPTKVQVDKVQVASNLESFINFVDNI